MPVCCGCPGCMTKFFWPGQSSNGRPIWRIAAVSETSRSSVPARRSIEWLEPIECRALLRLAISRAPALLSAPAFRVYMYPYIHKPVSYWLFPGLSEFCPAPWHRRTVCGTLFAVGFLPDWHIVGAEIFRTLPRQAASCSAGQTALARPSVFDPWAGEEMCFRFTLFDET